jgi:predicted glycogen debranching enzyme
MTADPIRSLHRPHDAEPYEPMPRREWLVTNGLGGYASGTVAGVITRRYHGLLVSALPAPLGRMVMLNHLLERVRLSAGRTLWLGDEQDVAGPNAVDRAGLLSEFRLELGLPVWRYTLDGIELEKRVLMPYGQNTVHVGYRLLSGDRPVRITLRPSVHFRGYEASVDASEPRGYTVTASAQGYELTSPDDCPPLRLVLNGPRAALTFEEKDVAGVPYRMEAARGYQSVGPLWSPGYFRADLVPGDTVTLVASTEEWDTLHALSPAEAAAAEMSRRRGLLHMAGCEPGGLEAELTLAADSFIITPAGRPEEAARARALGDEVRTVIAGYHWFTDWGRDTMISLEGLTLATGRHREAGYILRTFGHYVRDGLIPNMFPDGSREGLYHTADATLWFFHAVERYLRATGDRHTLRGLLPTLTEIIRRHVAGTRFGIQMDPADGLLRQGADGYQLTWMDAKVDDWVVTPRRGKAVEINALWYNALSLLAQWTREESQTSGHLDADGLAARARESFNRRFWSDRHGHLLDVVDGEGGDDAACRPNQVFAISLDHPVLDRERWGAVLEVVRARLLTPVGLRSLAPGHPDYKSRYFGDLRARDAAYHQGTVWGWLIGPFVDAWIKTYPEDRAGARALLDGFDAHLGEACVGSISEIFDAEPPYVPRGCVAQAWSVAEVLRCLVKTGRIDGIIGQDNEPADRVRVE